MFENKIGVVILVILIILAGISLFLVNLERRINKLEKDWKEKKMESKE
ncbi:MAG TPA: hypothetical protein PLE85_06275 [Bacteroidales bacterium]|nr:hypothetical protein [Lentimicrobiaceae bacterium]HOI00134.1 hypothetical protein [Bacteroidales bacterium]